MPEGSAALRETDTRWIVDYVNNEHCRRHLYRHLIDFGLAGGAVLLTALSSLGSNEG